MTHRRQHIISLHRKRYISLWDYSKKVMPVMALLVDSLKDSGIFRLLRFIIFYARGRGREECGMSSSSDGTCQLKVACLRLSAKRAAGWYDTIGDTSSGEKGVQDIMRTVPVNCVKGGAQAQCAVCSCAFSRTARSSKSTRWLCGATVNKIRCFFPQY